MLSKLAVSVLKAPCESLSSTDSLNLLSRAYEHGELGDAGFGANLTETNRRARWSKSSEPEVVCD